MFRLVKQQRKSLAEEKSKKSLEIFFPRERQF